MVAVKKQHPELDIRFVFYQRPFETLESATKRNVKQIKWAEKIGFRWSIGMVPADWLRGL